MSAPHAGRYEALERAVGHHFRDPALLRRP